MQSLKRIRKRWGRCYELAWKVMAYEAGAKDFRLVHGKIVVHGVPIDHAWIALPDGRIYDPVFDEYSAPQDYAKRYTAEVTYTQKETMHNVATHRHYGRWHYAIKKQPAS
jgi:hypothetical protein